MLWKIIYFLPGAAIGFILSTAIFSVDEATGMVFIVLGIVIGGSITAVLGNMLFLKAEIEAQESRGFISLIIRFLVFAIIIVAAILALAKFGIINI